MICLNARRYSKLRLILLSVCCWCRCVITLTDRAPIISIQQTKNTARGCQSDSWSAGQRNKLRKRNEPTKKQKKQNIPYNEKTNYQRPTKKAKARNGWFWKSSGKLLAANDSDWPKTVYPFLAKIIGDAPAFGYLDYLLPDFGRATPVSGLTV